MRVKGLNLRFPERFLRAATSVFVVLALGLAPAREGSNQQSQSRQPDVWRALRTIERGIPTPAPDHPGNVFLEGEEVVVKAPGEVTKEAVSWQALDDQAVVVARGQANRGQPSGPFLVRAGKLGIGWYRFEFFNAEGKCVGWTSGAVLARLAEPVPQDSPICVDSATAWFAPNDPAKQKRLARLAALAGVNWIRDRMSWGGMQPAPERFAANTTYDTAATIQARLGLKVLQVFHDTPRWAVDKSSTTGRFPSDLRVLYKFCRALGERYRGRVLAWEPWNEANIRQFGGHTVDEMCAHQKAAYLGFKAGDPDLIVGWNAYAAVPKPLHTKGVLENEAWPYFDTYNIHTYDWPESYERLRAPAREAACGRPIWLTECDRGMKYETGPPWFELSQRNERLKAEFMAQSYASSLFAGCHRHFHFILGHYTEHPSDVQFGLLRLDQTPRPAYVALAALGRLLAGARCLGKWQIENRPDQHVYAFRARPDGVERDVLVAWTEKPVDWPSRGLARMDWSLPEDVSVEAVFDYLGRPLGKSAPKQLKSSAIFITLPAGESRKLPLRKPEVSEFREGKASPVVLQIQMPPGTPVKTKDQPWSSGFEHMVEAGKDMDLSLFVYNFSEKRVSGRVSVERIPNGWTLTPDRWEVALEPMERKPLPARFSMSADESDSISHNWIPLRGDFGDAGRPVLAFRLVAKP